MHEAAVKAQVLGHIRRASGRRSPAVTAEFTLGKSSIRADLALFADEELIGLEIKTERDTLRRLPSQLEAYSRFFDHAVVVTAPCHVNAIMTMNLFGASLWITDKNGIEVVSVGSLNAVDSSAHLDLMTREEKKHVKTSTASAVRAHYCEVFTRRYGQTSSAFWGAVSGRRIKPSDIRRLSRFAEQRDAIKVIAREKDERWQRWRDAYQKSQLTAQPSRPSPPRYLRLHLDDHRTSAIADAG